MGADPDLIYKYGMERTKKVDTKAELREKIAAMEAALIALGVLLERDRMNLSDIVHARMCVEKGLGIHELRTEARRKAAGIGGEE